MTSPTSAAERPLRILAISGSLRARSSNTSLLRLAIDAAPDDVTIVMYDGLATLPHFNPDDDVDLPPAPVLDLRARVGEADGLLFCSPEYAHGVPGSLKNALDWVVGGSEIVDKPVGVLSASAASRFAHPQLIEVLKTMSASIVPEATVVIDIPRRGVDVERLVVDPVLGPALRNVVTALLTHVPAAQGTIP